MTDFTKVQQSPGAPGLHRTHLCRGGGGGGLPGRRHRRQDRGLRRLRHPGRSGGVRQAGGPQHRHLALEAGGGRCPEGGHADPGVPVLCQWPGGDRGRSSTSTAPATGWPPRCSAMRRSTSSSAGTSWPPPTRRRCAGPGTWPRPKRARQLGKKTPCAVKADRCYDCRSPERVCRALVTLWGPMLGMETEVLLVDEDLGL